MGGDRPLIGTVVPVAAQEHFGRELSFGQSPQVVCDVTLRRADGRRERLEGVDHVVPAQGPGQFRLGHDQEEPGSQVEIHRLVEPVAGLYQYLTARTAVARQLAYTRLPPCPQFRLTACQPATLRAPHSLAAEQDEGEALSVRAGVAHPFAGKAE